MKKFRVLALALLAAPAQGQGQNFGPAPYPPLASTSAAGLIGPLDGNSSHVVLGTGLFGAVPGLRTKLAATLTLFVSPTGNDGNSCLSGGTSACATLQGAVNIAENNYDTQGNEILIQLQNSTTYTGATNINGPLVGNGLLFINGNGGAATLTALNDQAVTVSNGAVVDFKNITFTNTTNNGGTQACLQANSAAYIVMVSGITEGACNGAGFDAQQGATILFSAGGYTIAGNGGVLGQSSIHAHSQGLVDIDAATITCTGTPAFTQYYVGVGEGGVATFIGASFSGCGSMVGPKFTTNRGSAIRTTASGEPDLNFLPGSARGVAQSNGVLDDYGTGGFQSRNITGSGSSDAASTSDHVISWQSNSGSAKTQTLPACTATGGPWQQLVVIDDFGDAATNNITITASGTTFNAQANQIIRTNNGSVMVICDGGTNYQVLFSNNVPSSRVTGTVSGGCAAAGILGECFTASVAAGTPVSLTSGSGNVSNVASVALTAGNWFCSTVADYTPGSGTVTTHEQLGLNTISAAMSTNWTAARGSTTSADLAGLQYSDFFNLNASGTVYAVTSANFTVSTLGAYGKITCLRTS